MPTPTISAVVLSAEPVQLRLPGLTVVPFVSRFSDAAGLLDARLSAIERVESDWFFFLDDDDELPADYLRVVGLCAAAGKPLAYTDEVITHADGSQWRRRSAQWGRAAHLSDMLLIHHLAVCNTAAARTAARVIPRGRYALENSLYFEVARRGGAAYLPEVGYIWHRRPTGLHRHPSVLASLVASSEWARRGTE